MKKPKARSILTVLRVPPSLRTDEAKKKPAIPIPPAKAMFEITRFRATRYGLAVVADREDDHPDDRKLFDELSVGSSVTDEQVRTDSDLLCTLNVGHLDPHPPRPVGALDGPTNAPCISAS